MSSSVGRAPAYGAGDPGSIPAPAIQIVVKVSHVWQE